MRLRVVLLVLTALALVPISAPLAHAGGPTSVLMVNPAREEARAAYVSDPVYAELTTALGDGAAGSVEAPATDGAEEVRLTWLIHDVQIWRIDRVHLDTGGDVWVETTTDFGGGGRMFDRPASWHRPADAETLVAALASAGLLGQADARPSPAPRPVATPAPHPMTETTATTVPTTRALPAAVVAGLSGLLLGVAATLGGVRLRRRATRPREPRAALLG